MRQVVIHRESGGWPSNAMFYQAMSAAGGKLEAVDDGDNCKYITYTGTPAIPEFEQILTKINKTLSFGWEG